MTGTPGSGKSLHAAAEIREYLNYERPVPVIANFRLAKDAPVRHPERFTYMPNDELSAGRLIDFANDFWDSGQCDFREDFLQLYIDEAQICFNSRNWNDKRRMSYLEFLSQSRKYGYRIVLIAQSAKMIDNQFRMLIETECNHRRVSSMGLLGALVSLPFRGRLFMTVRTMFQVGEKQGMGLMVYRQKNARMYDSYARFEKM